MATVTSLTETRIQELLAGWEAVGLSQDEINALVLQIRLSVDANEAALENFNTVVRPQLEADLAAGAAAVSDLNDIVLPDLQAELSANALALQNIQAVDIPALVQNLSSISTNVNERPKVYVQDEPPDNPDDDDRDLIVGDTWFDSNDDNTQRIWNGVEWSTFGIDIPDFSITVKKFMTNTHQIY